MGEPRERHVENRASDEIFFDPLQKLGIRYVAVYGNHDVTYRNTNEVNGMDFLQDMYDNVKIIETRTVMNMDGVKFGLIGWINKKTSPNPRMAGNRGRGFHRRARELTILK